PAGSRLVGVPHTPGTREYLTCETGAIVLAVAGETWRLGPGDVVAFRGDQRHTYTNPATHTPVRYSVVLFAPVSYYDLPAGPRCRRCGAAARPVSPGPRLREGGGRGRRAPKIINAGSRPHAESRPAMGFPPPTANVRSMDATDRTVARCSDGMKRFM